MSKKKNKPEVGYGSIGFNIANYPGCCGISVIEDVSAFIEDTYNDGDEESYYTKEQWKEDFPFTTVEASNKDFYKRLCEQRQRSYLQMALVSKYQGEHLKDGTYIGQNNPLLEFLIYKKGWDVLQQFKNSNTNNEVTVIGKTFPKKKRVGRGIFGW